MLSHQRRIRMLRQLGYDVYVLEIAADVFFFPPLSPPITSDE